MIPVIGLLQSKVPGLGDHPLLPQVEVLTSLSLLQVKVNMDPPIVTRGVLVMVTPAAVDGVGHTTALKVYLIVVYDHEMAYSYPQLNSLDSFQHS